MNHKNLPKTASLLALLALLFASLACAIDLDGGSEEDVALQQTAVALQQTQIALEAQVNPTNAEQSVEPATETAQVIVEPANPPSVDYEGIQFSFETTVAEGVTPETIPGQNMGEDYMPGDTYPTYFEFTLDNYAVPSHFHSPVIRVYPVDEYRAISTAAAGNIDALQQALVNRPAGGVNSHLPFLPIWNAAQMFADKVGYFDFQNGSGVRYLTMYGQAVYPLDNQNLFYTFQGLTHDGRYYISAILPVTHAALPMDGSAQIGDWMTFNDNWDTYIHDAINWLEAQDSAAFSPNLSALDSMMASFQINR